MGLFFFFLLGMCVCIAVNWGVCTNECGYDWRGKFILAFYQEASIDDHGDVCRSHYGDASHPLGVSKKRSALSHNTLTLLTPKMYQVLGAHRAQITKVIIPWGNRKDVEYDVAMEIRNEMEFVYVRTVGEVLEAAFGKNGLVWRRGAGASPVLLESRL
jgi:hypothetical protein